MTQNRYWQLNAFRAAVYSDGGPPEAATRHLLQTLSSWAGPGGVCFPSQRAICRRSRLDIRTVRKAIRAAESAHWLTSYPHQKRPGRAWKYTVYTLHTPDEWQRQGNFAPTSKVA